MNLGSFGRYPAMGISQTEVNLLRLLDSAPRQKNQAKLIHFVTTSHELLEKLAAENSSEAISSVSKAKLNDYSYKIKELAARLASEMPDHASKVQDTIEEQNIPDVEKVGSLIDLSSGLRRRFISELEDGKTISDNKRDIGAPIRLDEAAQAYNAKHRKLQEDLSGEMVVLARQLKETSLLMNQSVQETEMILDSTERAVEYSLASTGRANADAVEVYSVASRTTCFQWLLFFVMTCIFLMVVLLTRVT